jgi:hypothetical protein
MIIERHWAMPNHKTFSIKPLKNLIDLELGTDYLDPFPFPFKQDAVEYLKNIPCKFSKVFSI